VILGTSAIEQPDLIKAGVEQFGSDRIIIGIDAKDGLVATHGWQKYTNLAASEFAQKMEKLGAIQFIFTDIKTDGMFTGPNIEALTEFAKSVSANVTASGGIRNIKDIKRLKNLNTKNIDSVIVGKAIYEKRIDLKEAIQYLQGEN
jgi:phosphoribosylformimino-5-aminoimidazole carboxamide ribotide isomerase